MSMSGKFARFDCPVARIPIFAGLSAVPGMSPAKEASVKQSAEGVLRINKKRIVSYLHSIRFYFSSLSIFFSSRRMDRALEPGASLAIFSIRSLSDSNFFSILA